MNPNPNIHHMPSPVEQLMQQPPIFDKSGYVIFIERPGNLKSYLKVLNLSVTADEWTSKPGDARVFRFKIQAKQFQDRLAKLGYVKTEIATTDDVDSPTWK